MQSTGGAYTYIYIYKRTPTVDTVLEGTEPQSCGIENRHTMPEPRVGSEYFIDV